MHRNCTHDFAFFAALKQYLDSSHWFEGMLGNGCLSEGKKKIIRAQLFHWLGFDSSWLELVADTHLGLIIIKQDEEVPDHLLLRLSAHSSLEENPVWQEAWEALKSELGALFPYMEASIQDFNPLEHDFETYCEKARKLTKGCPAKQQ